MPIDPELTLDPDGMEYQVNVDELDRDPKQQARLKYLLEAEHYRRNIILLSEFESKYIALFRKETATIDPALLQNLSKDYLGRIDPYYPVYIVKAILTDKVAELLRADNIVYTLPPIFNRVGVVNNLGRDGIDIMQAFNNLATAGHDDRFDVKKKQYSGYMKLVIENMTDPVQIEVNRNRAKQISEAALQRSDDYKNNRASTIANDPSLDVQDLPEDMLEDLDQAIDNTTVYEKGSGEEFL